MHLLRRILIPVFSLFILTSASFAQFGKNKVQYQEFNWKYIQSRHFDVYFYQGGEYLGRYTAIEAERALQSIQRTLNYSLTRRVSIVIYESHGEFQQTNVVSSYLPEGVGGVTELFKNRVVLPFEGRYDQFRHVIHHELVHAVLNDMFYGGTFQSAISNNVRVELPLWMNEGFAEYESLGGYDPQTDMFMRDVTLSEFVQGLDYLNGYFAYRGGQAFYWYVSEKYGKGKVGELLNRIKALGDVNAAFKSSFNMSYEDFSEKWVKDMKKLYWPDIDKYEDPEDFATRITNHKKTQNFYNSSPALSPDGERVAFISDRDGVFGVYILNLRQKETEAQRIISSDRTSDFEELNLLTPGISWDPTGKRIAVSAKAGGEDALFIVDVDNNDYQRIRLGFKQMASASWSPDGKYIAFVASRNEASNLYLYEVGAGRLDTVTNDVFSDELPAWAPDSKTIYFVSDRGENLTEPPGFRMWNYDAAQSDIYRVDISTRVIERITSDPKFNKTSIAISPDGAKMLFVSDKNGIGNLYEMDLASRSIRPKTNSLTGITQLALARDASKLLFTSQNGGGYDIFSLRFPLERTVNFTELPLTKYRQGILEKDTVLKGLSSAIDTTGNRDTTVGYGNFDIDFSRQQVVTTNPDLPASGAGDMADAQNIDTNFVVRDYKVSFTPDLIMGNAGYNTFWGIQGQTQMLFSDVLGDHQIYVAANLLIDIKNSNFLFAYSYLPDIIDYQLTGFHNVGFVFLPNQSPSPTSNDVLYRFRNYGLGTSAYYPLDRFNRFEAGLTWYNMSRENVENVDPPVEPTLLRTLFVPEVRYVHDDAQWGYYAPVSGSRYYASALASPKVGANGLGFSTFMTDIRQYIQFGRGLTGLAFRFSGGASFGPNAQQFFLGGTENWINAQFAGDNLPFTQPEDFAFQYLIYPLRGFEINQSRGSKFFVGNAELRFPIVQAIVTGGVPILFQALMGNVFFDIGGAWNDRFRATRVETTFDGTERLVRQDLLMSAGVGIRTFALGLPIKFDVAWRNEFHTWSIPQYLISLGGDF